MIGCSWKQSLGIECPGCGFQRSFWALLQGNISESFELFPATIPLLVTVVVAVLHLIFKFRHGAWTITVFFCLSALLMVTNLVTNAFHMHAWAS